MNVKLIKLGFYVLTIFLFFFSSTLLVEYRYMTDDNSIREVELNESFMHIFWLLIVSGIFGISTLVMIFKDWMRRKRLPFYIGTLAFGLIILMGITILFILN